MSRAKTVAVILATALLAGCGQKGSEQLLINGAGATFPYPIYSKWSFEYRKVDPTVSINYQSIGSGGGQKSILDGTVDFGASDGPMSDENLAKAPGKILHIPTVAGADVVTYNLPGNPTLQLDGPAIAAIFLGKVTKWNDAKIAAQNPGVKLPATDIAVVHRSDGSGTTFIFVDYLSSISQEWESSVGRGTAVKWPAGQGAKGNEGVMEQVKQMPGSIGYVELVYAVQQKLPFASVKNAAGRYVAPSIASVTAALATAKIPGDFRFSMVNPPGEKAYPIAGTTWLLVYQKQADARKGKKLVEFLKWAETQGQAMAAPLNYAPLPEELTKSVLREIDSITY
ncbi:MAG TPA: phosphate ABC transporter substrate-binding protein PstS [Candidatus Acidoferrum sp.]|nr:phosphate ABC transporter substrate-binding protein PstS [Candidatus Acidoferrum sp.]